MANEFYKIFKENFPYIVREENTVNGKKLDLVEMAKKLLK